MSLCVCERWNWKRPVCDCVYGLEWWFFLFCSFFILFPFYSYYCFRIILVMSGDWPHVSKLWICGMLLCDFVDAHALMGTCFCYAKWEYGAPKHTWILGSGRVDRLYRQSMGLPENSDMSIFDLTRVQIWCYRFALCFVFKEVTKVTMDIKRIWFYFLGLKIRLVKFGSNL